MKKFYGSISQANDYDESTYYSHSRAGRFGGNVVDHAVDASQRCGRPGQQQGGFPSLRSEQPHSGQRLVVAQILGSLFRVFSRGFDHTKALDR
jgi:hypothetical protein